MRIGTMYLLAPGDTVSHCEGVYQQSSSHSSLCWECDKSLSRHYIVVGGAGPFCSIACALKKLMVRGYRNLSFSPNCLDIAGHRLGEEIQRDTLQECALRADAQRIWADERFLDMAQAQDDEQEFREYLEAVEQGGIDVVVAARAVV